MAEGDLGLIVAVGDVVVQIPGLVQGLPVVPDPAVAQPASQSQQVALAHDLPLNPGPDPEVGTELCLHKYARLYHGLLQTTHSNFMKLNLLIIY